MKGYYTVSKKNERFHGFATKMRLVSAIDQQGLGQRADEETEQYLTISRSGQIWFSGYGYDENGDHVKLRQFQERISRERANLILASLGFEMAQRNEQVLGSDMGVWELDLTNEEGETFVSYGELLPDEKQLHIISDDLRQLTGWNSLYVFDGRARFLLKKKPEEKIFVKIRSIVSPERESEWFFYEGCDICIGDRFDAPTRRGDRSYMAEVEDIIVATPEKGPVSVKKQEKMQTLSIRY